MRQRITSGNAQKVNIPSAPIRKLDEKFKAFDALPKKIRDFLNEEAPCRIDPVTALSIFRAYGLEKTMSVLNIFVQEYLEAIKKEDEEWCQ